MSALNIISSEKKLRVGGTPIFPSTKNIHQALMTGVTVSMPLIIKTEREPAWL